MIVVGIDPGPATTGLVARHRDTLLAFSIVTREQMSLAAYARLVLDRAGGHPGSVAGRAERVCHHPGATTQRCTRRAGRPRRSWPPARIKPARNESPRRLLTVGAERSRRGWEH